MALPESVSPAITAAVASPGSLAGSVRVRSRPNHAPRPKDQRPQGSGPRVPSADTGHRAHEQETWVSHERSVPACPGDDRVV